MITQRLSITKSHCRLLNKNSYRSRFDSYFYFKKENLRRIGSLSNSSFRIMRKRINRNTYSVEVDSISHNVCMPSEGEKIMCLCM